MEGVIVDISGVGNSSTFLKFTKKYDPDINYDVAISDIKNGKYDTFSNNNSAKKDVKTTIKENKGLLAMAFTALSPVIPFRRISSAPDKIENGDYKGLAGLLAVAGIMLPEDLRDMKDAFNQLFRGKLPDPKLKEYQTPFSFIRGTLLQPVVNKMGKLGYYIHESDKTLFDTGLGKKIMNKLNVKEIDEKETGRTVKKIVEKDGKYIVDDVAVVAKKLEGSGFGRLIGRAMQRTTLFSIAALSLICVPSIINAFKKGNTTEEKVISGGKQTVKSAISVSSVTAGIGFFGALLARRGPAGSVIGMGIGSVVGALFSKKINNNILN